MKSRSALAGIMAVTGSRPPMVLAPTVSAPGALAGVTAQALLSEFPAATTLGTPTARRSAMAALRLYETPVTLTDSVVTMGTAGSASLAAST